MSGRGWRRVSGGNRSPKKIGRTTGKFMATTRRDIAKITAGRFHKKHTRTVPPEIKMNSRTKKKFLMRETAIKGGWTALWGKLHKKKSKIGRK